MQEDFLHYIWKYKKFDVLSSKTTEKENVAIICAGEHNYNSGPDFFNAQIKIDDQLWAGNVEIHIRSSDWYIHNHEIDKAYDNVILHVVWDHDTDVYRKNNTPIPTLELKQFVEKNILESYHKLISKSNKWINCEQDIKTVDNFVLNNWIERLYLERLERKALNIKDLLEKSNNDWEAVLFKMLAKNFGLKTNGDAFLSLANSIDFSVVRKCQDNLLSLEALLLGQSGLLDDEVQEEYHNQLKKEYTFLTQKFNISNESVLPIQFFRLRPLNFPTIRLSQLASLYHKSKNLFSELIEAKTVSDIYNIFSVNTSIFWETHYTFQKTSKPSKKRTTKSFIDLLIINTIVPVKFAYNKERGKLLDESIITLINQIKPESNSIISKFNSLGVNTESALQTQALLQLKQNYCRLNKCLECAIGNTVLNRKM